MHEPANSPARTEPADWPAITESADSPATNERLVRSIMRGEIPIVTAVGTYTTDRIAAALDNARPFRNTRLVQSGLQLGLGPMGRVVSNYPGNSHLLRPFTAERGRLPAISTWQLFRNIQEVRGEIARVTIKIGNGSSLDALFSVTDELQETLNNDQKIVVSSSNPDLLKRAQDLGIRPDVWQQIIPDIGDDEMESVLEDMRRSDNIVDGAELCITPPIFVEPGPSEQEKVTDFMWGHGHDAYLRIEATDPGVVSAEVGKAIAGLIGMNTALVNSNNRVRGLYMDDPFAKFNPNEGSRLGIHLVTREASIRRDLQK